MSEGLKSLIPCVALAVLSVAIAAAPAHAQPSAETGMPRDVEEVADDGDLDAPPIDEASDVLDSEEALLQSSIEEITVTATKREQALQDVPISMAALGSQTLLDAGITEFAQLQGFVPNLQIFPSTDTRSTSVRIRGIGSVGSNAGIDPSVGIFIDGVYQGRAGMSVGDLFDIERVEVLRGPQGTLYGKNTAAGAINVITKSPSYEWESLLEGTFGDYDNKNFRAFLNAPLVDDLMALRVAGFYHDRDGWDLNRFDGQRVNDANRWGIRAKLAIDVTEDFTVLLNGDYMQEDTKSFVADIAFWNSGVDPAVPGGPSLTGINFLNLSNTTGIPLPPADPFDNVVGANVQPINQVSVGGLAADAMLDVGEHRLRWLNAWRTYSSGSQFDGDFSEFDAVIVWQNVNLEQFSSELTWTSPSWERLEAQAGLFFYYMSMYTVDRNGWEQGLYDTARTFPGNSLQRLLFGLVPPPIFNVNDNHHETFSTASYGEFTYTILDDLFFTGGLRVTYEQKDWAGANRTVGWPAGFPVPDAPPILGPPKNTDESRGVTNLQGKLVLRYHPFDEVMVYGSFANGFKSGGFNQQRTGTDESSEFDDEKSLTYELGTRTQWLDRRVTLNVTGYFTDYDDFQAQIFTGSSINVRNAGRVFSYGFEGDLSYLPELPDGWGSLTTGAQVGLNIADYDEFPGAVNTVQGQWDESKAAYFADPSDPLLSLPVTACGQIDCNQDLTGRPVGNAPRWTFTAYTGYDYPLPRSLILFFRADYSYTSGHYLDQDLDEHLYQTGYNLLNLRGGLRAEDELWELTLWMNNVTDTNYLVVGFDVPIISGFAGVKGPPRHWGATLRLRF